ncbi:MAG: hypothetical protein LBP53_06790 [Candidatus Peribacteria bacterium]|jgi:hypothetical protein|nr:hypothetical protein [Candidatus Peribacteria bacterium]
MEEEPTEDVIKDESIDENQVIDEKIEFEDNEVNISSVMINDNIEVFTGDTTWIVPNGITEVEVFAVGGGG